MQEFLLEYSEYIVLVYSEYSFSPGSETLWSHGPGGGADGDGARTCRIHPDGPRGAPRELGRAAGAPRAPQYH